MQFFDSSDLSANSNRLKSAARLLWANRDYACDFFVPGTLPRQFQADVSRWRNLASAWKRGFRTPKLFAGWRQAQYIDLALCEPECLSDKVTLYTTILEEHENQPFVTSATVRYLSGYPREAIPQERKQEAFYVVPEIGPEKVPEVDPAEEYGRMVRRVKYKRAVIAELIDCPPKTRKLSKCAFVLYRDLEKFLKPLVGVKMYFVTMPGLSAKCRSKRLRELGWTVIWVTSGGKMGLHHHTHLLLIPPTSIRLRDGYDTVDQLAQNRAISAIHKALEPDLPTDLNIQIVNSLTSRLKHALYIAINRDHPLCGSTKGQHRSGMTQGTIARMTPEQKRLTHPRCPKSEMKTWYKTVDEVGLAYGHPVDGPKRWIYYKRKIISAAAKLAGPDMSVYADEIPEDLRELAQFSIMATLGDGREYALHFHGLHQPPSYEGLNDLKVDIVRKVREGEAPWSISSNWPILALQLLGIHTEVKGT